MAPIKSRPIFGLIVMGGGLFGITYCGLVVPDTVQDGLSASIDLHDRIWYAALPAICYMLMATSGIALALRIDFGGLVPSGSIGLLLIAGIRNAWDITVWIVIRRRS